MLKGFSAGLGSLNHGYHFCSLFQEVMSVEEESTSCYCLMDSTSCHLLLDQPGSYALVGEPLTQAAVKRLKLAVFGSMEANYTSYSLRVYCVDDTPHAFQVGEGHWLGVWPIVFYVSNKALISSSAVFHSFSASVWNQDQCIETDTRAWGIEIKARQIKTWWGRVKTKTSVA